MPANAKVVIILQYINVSNQHLVHLQLTQCFMSILSQWSPEGKERESRKDMGKKRKGHPLLNSPRLGEICDSLSGCESHCSSGNAQFHRTWPSDMGLRHCLASLWSQTNWNHWRLILCNNQKLWSDNNQQPWNLTCQLSAVDISELVSKNGRIHFVVHLKLTQHCKATIPPPKKKRIGHLLCNIPFLSLKRELFPLRTYNIFLRNIK